VANAGPWQRRGAHGRRGPQGGRRGPRYVLGIHWSVVCAIAVLVAFVGYQLATSPWSVTMTLRHLIAAPNCDMTRLVGLAPAYRGEPGYRKSHDRDNDGIACEPWPRDPRN
jgi:hypothetical protein